jgi:hypothetical protein
VDVEGARILALGLAGGRGRSDAACNKRRQTLPLVMAALVATISFR